MAVQMIDNARYAFGYEGNPAGPAARAKTLTGAGPLLVDKEHMVAKMLPGATDDGGGGKK